MGPWQSNAKEPMMANPMTADELEFVQAIETYKKEKSKHFLPWSEVLSILKALGYRKSMQYRRKKTPKKTASGQAGATQ